MNIYYTDKTLYVNLESDLDINLLMDLKNKVFGILDDYNIENIVIKKNYNNTLLLDEFVNEYKNKYNGNIKIR